MEKICTKCKKLKPNSDFYPDRRLSSGLGSSCKDCHADRRSKDRESGYIRDYHLKRRYGIGLADYQDKLEEQDNKCYICESPSGEGKFSRGNRVLHVDHCHETGQIRKLLCGECNTFIGKLELYNKNGKLQSFINYLKYCKDLKTK